MSVPIKMKMTKTQLKQIIKEEIGKVRQEMAPKGSLAGAAAQLDRKAGADLSPEQKEQLAYLLAKRGKQLASDPVKRNRQINYWIDLIKQRGQKDLDVTPSYIDDEDDMKAIAESIIGILTLMKEQDDPTKAFVEPEGDLEADPEHYEGYVTDEDRTQFLQAYNIISKLTDLSEELRKNPTPDQEERIMREMRKLLDFDVLDPVDTAVFNMLGKLGIPL